MILRRKLRATNRVRHRLHFWNLWNLPWIGETDFCSSPLHSPALFGPETESTLFLDNSLAQATPKTTSLHEGGVFQTILNAQRFLQKEFIMFKMVTS